MKRGEEIRLTKVCDDVQLMGSTVGGRYLLKIGIGPCGISGDICRCHGSASHRVRAPSPTPQLGVLSNANARLIRYSQRFRGEKFEKSPRSLSARRVYYGTGCLLYWIVRRAELAIVEKRR